VQKWAPVPYNTPAFPSPLSTIIWIAKTIVPNPVRSPRRYALKLVGSLSSATEQFLFEKINHTRRLPLSRLFIIAA